MIKPEELRIGNWVKWPNEKEPNEVPWSHGHWMGVFEKNYPFPEPIPLTEDWLIKFGFEKLPPSFENCLNPYWAKDGVVLFFTETPPVNTYLLSVGFTFEGKYFAATSRWISEVHLLQNYYYAHLGKELTISEPTKQSE